VAVACGPLFLAQKSIVGVGVGSKFEEQHPP
jgi:hypothetical protein